jgi:pimeloyl-[acyl-carrier protein] methyl ester esterase
MWSAQRTLLPGATHTPTLYSFGESLESWASRALEQTHSDRLIVVGCSVGGSCALEIAAIAPARVAALVLIGTKAEHRPEPKLQAQALNMLRDQGIEAAWLRFWAPLLSPEASPIAVDTAKQIALRQSVFAISDGVTAFHRRMIRGHVLTDFSGPIIASRASATSLPGSRQMPLRRSQRDSAASTSFLSVAITFRSSGLTR